MAQTSRRELARGKAEKRIEDLEHACGLLVTFPGMREFVGNLIFEEVVALLGPQEELDADDNGR